MCDNNLPIGVFDSGFGGLTVAREIFRNLPNEKIIYYGDTARVPYGNKSQDTVIRYSKQISRFLISKGVKAIVIACNTASALALDAVQASCSIPVIGVVKPGADAAVRASASGRIGIIGTSGTIASGLYDRYIKELLPSAQVFGKACPLFVHLVEEGMIDDSVTVEMIHRYLDGMISRDNIDTLILGCTHYPLLRSVIAREIGGVYADFTDNASDSSPCSRSGHPITLVNPAYTTAKALAGLLNEKGLASDIPVSPHDHEFFCSDGPDNFRSFASEVLNMQIDRVHLKVLE
ncbi:MAG: glutamate racemase [Parasporobacterium sp.]|nr:glutamate racemase [Parasporobacterium sp.]